MFLDEYTIAQYKIPHQVFRHWPEVGMTEYSWTTVRQVPDEYRHLVGNVTLTPVGYWDGVQLFSENVKDKQ